MGLQSTFTFTFQESLATSGKVRNYLNPFSTNVSLPINPLKTSENLGFSYVFRGCRSGTLVENGLKRTVKVRQINISTLVFYF